MEETARRKNLGSDPDYGDPLKKLKQGDPEWFFWFLCSRWGKTVAEISSLSSREFWGHYCFWKQSPWGIESDLLSSSIRVTMPSSMMSSWDLKNASMYDAAFQPVEIEQDWTKIWFAMTGINYEDFNASIKPA